MNVKAKVAMVGALAATLAITSTVGASPTPPTPELWIMNADGSDPTKIATSGYFRSFDWSPDGTHFAYVATSLVVVEVATGQHREIVTPPEYPDDIAWSPDGSTILYSFSEQDGQGLRTIAPDGTNKQTVLTAASGVIVAGPDWSPDGREISFIQGPGSGVPGHLHVLDASVGTLRRASSHDAHYAETDWSPDGNWIAYDSWGSELRVVRRDGTDDKTLSPGFAYASAFEWAPDSAQIAFTGTRRVPAQPDADTGTWLVSPVDATPQLVIPNGYSPSWSPDGTRIAYSSGGDIYTSDRSGGAVRRITLEELQDDTSPAWSPDGTRIAFTRTPVHVYCPGPPWPINASIVGTSGDDRLEGTPDADVIAGRGGNDEIIGLEGNDVVCGGPGDDSVLGGDGDDRVYGEEGHDIVQGDAGNDTVDGGFGDDVIVGGEGRDTLSHSTTIGSVIVNLVVGEATGHGRDVLDGIEDVTGTSQRDLLVGDGGPNRLFGSDLFGDARPDDIRGGGGADHLEGSGGSDRLRGGGGRDHLDGDSQYSPRLKGEDVLNGGRGRDRCENGERYRSCERRG